LKKPNIREIIQFADEFEKNSSTQFASAVLGSIVSEYLKYNKCGYIIRKQLCNRFKFSGKKILIEEMKNRKM
jgi:hypothetical protein